MDGYAGRILRVDLSAGTLSPEPLTVSVARKWLGGVGLGIKYVAEEVPPDASWNHPDNRLVLASGPLGGTRVCGSGTICACTKGALTGGAASAQANGYLGAYLKLCGFDALVITGAAEDWMYLEVDQDGARLRDARHLAGLDTAELQEVLRAETGGRQASIYGIGPAGERLVRFACLVGDGGHVAAHNGVGAVMGAKKLKAIVVVKAKASVPVDDPTGLRDVAKALSEKSKTMGLGPMISRWGTSEGYPHLEAAGALPVKNLTTNSFPAKDKFTGSHIRSAFTATKSTCWACTWAHCRDLEIHEGKYAGFKGEEPEYEGMAAMGAVIGQEDPAAAIVLGNTVDRLGMDVNESGWVIGWAMECYEKGYLSREDLGGLDLHWGNADAAAELLRMIATREGIGDLLAEGVKRAAESIGGKALECAVFTQKGNTPRSHDHRAVWPELFDTCLSGTGTIEATGGTPYPDQHGFEPITDRFDWEQVIRQNARLNGRMLFIDCLGICRFPAEDIKLVIDCVNASTGWDLDLGEVMTIGKRIANLLRVFNLRSGLSADSDAPSVRYGSSPIDGPAKGISSGETWEQTRSRYYELMGWHPETGHPLPGTLQGLGIAEEVAQLRADRPRD